MMHVVVFSDLHLHNWPNLAVIDPDTGLNSRMMDGIRILGQICQYCKDKHIDTIIFGGDAFEKSKKLEPDLLGKFAEVMVDMAKVWDLRMFFLPGQHDNYSQEFVINALQPFEYFYCLMDKVGEWEITNSIKESVHIITCPHRRSIEDQRNDLKKCQGLLREGHTNILLGHFLVKEILEADNAYFGDKDYIEYADLPKGCDLYLFGDYHPHVWVPELKLVSIGATNHHSFKDKNKPQGGFLDLDLDTMTFNRIELDAPMFIELAPGERPKDTKHFYSIPTHNGQEEDRLRANLGEKFQFVFKPIVEEEEVDEDAPRLAVDFNMTPEAVIQEYCNYMGQNEVVLARGLGFLQ